MKKKFQAMDMSFPGSASLPKIVNILWLWQAHSLYEVVWPL